MNYIIALSRRIETAYLGTLRIVVLVIATLFVVVAAFYIADGLRKLTLDTEVEQEPVKLAPDEVLAKVAVPKQKQRASGATAPGDSDAYKAFMNATFSQYHRSYATLARDYNKSEDRILTPNELAAHLGYSQEAFEESDDLTVRRFAEDREYSEAILATAAALGSDARLQDRLKQYRTAQKTARACGTAYVSRRLWDSNSMACSDWYQDPMGCPVIRQVPVERCVAAYPDGVTSPLNAFTQMDAGFRTLWTTRYKEAAAEAEAREAKLTADKEDGMPTVLRAAYVFGAFLIVMFMFLVIAIERHLRRLAQGAREEAPSAAEPRFQAAE